MPKIITTKRSPTSKERGMIELAAKQAAISEFPTFRHGAVLVKGGAVLSLGVNKNQFHLNYWSEYNGYDLDRDGVGDVEYQPVKLFSYITDKTPESIILIRSLFIDIINFSEKVSPIFISEKIKDKSPSIKIINDIL